MILLFIDFVNFRSPFISFKRLFRRRQNIVTRLTEKFRPSHVHSWAPEIFPAHSLFCNCTSIMLSRNKKLAFLLKTLLIRCLLLYGNYGTLKRLVFCKAKVFGVRRRRRPALDGTNAGANKKRTRIIY